MFSIKKLLLGAAAVALITVPFQAPAQEPRPAAPTTSAPAQPASPQRVPATQLPTQTTATFGDWVYRCVRGGGDAIAASCEVFQRVQASQGGQATTLMDLAIGYAAPRQPLLLTAVLPVNVSFVGPATILVEGIQATDLRFVRCAGTACFATAQPPEHLLRRLREKPDTVVRVEYRNAADGVVDVPLSLKGFGEAMDALVAALPR